MARTRDEDHDDEPDDRPRDRDDDEDDRPRRRRRRDDNDDDYEGSGPKEFGPLDKTFRDTNIVVLIIFGCCCGIIAFALSLACMLTAKDQKAKSNAMIVLIISAIVSVLHTVSLATGQFNQMNFGR